MRCRFIAFSLLSIWFAFSAAAAWAEIPANQAEKIRKAAPEKPRAATKKARTVLIWNTPPHLMEKDPHKGYCIPYGEAAIKALGEKTGAFKPVTSDDVQMYLPEKIKQFDAIVMNNSNSWARSSRATRGTRKWP